MNLPMPNSNPQFVVTLNGLQVLSVAASSGERATMRYDASGSLVRCVDARSNILTHMSENVGQQTPSANPANVRTTMPFDIGRCVVNPLGIASVPVTYVYNAERKTSGLHFPDKTPVAAVRVVSANTSALPPIAWGSPDTYAALSELHQTLLRLRIEFNPCNRSACMDQLFDHSEFTKRLELGSRVAHGHRRCDPDLLEEIEQAACVQFFELVRGDDVPYTDDGPAYFGGWLTVTLYRMARRAQAADDNERKRTTPCSPEFFDQRADDADRDSPSEDYRKAVHLVRHVGFFGTSERQLCQFYF